MFSEIQIKRAQEKGVLPPSDDLIRQPGRYDVKDLIGKVNQEDDLRGGVDIRKVFEKGVNSKNIIVRGTTQIVKYVYDSGIILGSALSNEKEEGKK